MPKLRKCFKSFKTEKTLLFGQIFWSNFWGWGVNFSLLVHQTSCQKVILVSADEFGIFFTKNCHNKRCKKDEKSCLSTENVATITNHNNKKIHFIFLTAMKIEPKACCHMPFSGTRVLTFKVIALVTTRFSK